MSSEIALVVDDEPLVLRVLCRMVESAGFAPLPASDGLAALDLLRGAAPTPPRLVVSDINMPKLDGVGMVRILRERWATLPVVFVTGHHPAASEAAGLGEVVAKPFDSDMLLSAARRAILQGALDELLSYTGAEKGNVQLLDPRQEALVIEVQRGFAEPFLRHFRQVKQADCACGAALRDRAPTVIEDVRRSPVFEGQASLQVMLEADAVAVQSTPLLGGDGRLFGMLSTHYSAAHRFDLSEIGMIGEACRRVVGRIPLLLSWSATALNPPLRPAS